MPAPQGAEPEEYGMRKRRESPGTKPGGRLIDHADTAA